MKAGLSSDWGVFGTIFLGISGGMALAISRTDFAVSADVSHLIAVSVQLSVPWLYLAFAASSIASLWRANWSRWLLRKRRVLGLCYAGGMAWQLLFIVWVVVGHYDYYIKEQYSIYSIAEEIPGYVFLFAMVFTSFRFGRRFLSARQWKLLHTVGIYLLWAETWSTYWDELYQYHSNQPIDYVYYWAGLLVWGLRIAAWGKMRMRSELLTVASRAKRPRSYFAPRAL